MVDVRIHESWKTHLEDEFEKEYFAKLTQFVKEEYKNKTVFPPPHSIFSAFELCPFDKVKVVILGQDPYHGRGQANGLCFSVNDGVPVPPSLANIYKEIESDIGVKPHSLAAAEGPAVAGGLRPPPTGNLERWATHGVLLLNATLTVVASQAGSHQHKGWEEFTDAVIKLLSEKKEHLVFLLWGKYAQEKGAFIDEKKHLVLRAAHPSPFSAHSGFFGCKHFSKTNDYLEFADESSIKWA